MSRKSFQWEPTCSMQTGRRTDTTKLRVAFRTFANAPTNGKLLDHSSDCRQLYTASFSNGQKMPVLRGKVNKSITLFYRGTRIQGCRHLVTAAPSLQSCAY